MTNKVLIKSARRLVLVVLFLLTLQDYNCFAKEGIFNKNIRKKIISSIILCGDTIPLSRISDTIEVNANKFTFVEFNFVPPDINHVQLVRYYLKGLDAGFGEWTLKNSVSYGGLDHGTYAFVLESKVCTQTVYLEIKAPYNRYLFSTILLLLLIVFGITILKISLRGKGDAHSWQRDSIAPLLKKYIIRPQPPLTEVPKLTQRASVKYEKTTVLFADIQGFTKIVEHMNPENLIDELDRFFVHFDEVADKYRIEKIKTIGDAYMCAGGLPEKNRTNPIEVVMAAIEMQRFMQEKGQNAPKSGKDFWELRVGIHTGPVISGVVGRKKLSFDIWGDTVNIASRMESSGVAGKINISGVTYQLVKDFFECEYRGKMPIKYKGETDMYFVKGIVPHLSVKGEGIYPNEDFFTKLQWIRYNDLEEVVLGQLRMELPSSFKYHSIKHTIDVCTQVEVLGRAEGLNSKELLLVKTAALFHDTGYMMNPMKHEVQSVRIAKEILPHFLYTKSEIEAVSQLIMATESNTEPTLLMEKIIKDADLDYLGRADFIPLSEKLWEELCNYKGKISQKEWNKKQHAFLSKHVYYTETAKKLRQVNKEMQLNKIEKLLM
ncbi:adenylate/guanylate cyclase domain-containing protein [Saccharicrinis fermentans]|uniref:Adenylate cyclase n=1 Tax=Saccharicrinis fermentans DSM 9555 = JCM 21142 TaxID=869213 RepID=W7YD60_9BACT|nr:adenylate/guanylate cyclase domain-containing protein [Saccharicrinis fermentans]GAF02411.1 adenylate cyclase [Saccharicrinis fermentans DSM 9555 = JCM 21142]